MRAASSPRAPAGRRDPRGRRTCHLRRRLEFPASGSDSTREWSRGHDTAGSHQHIPGFHDRFPTTSGLTTGARQVPSCPTSAAEAMGPPSAGRQTADPRRPLRDGSLCGESSPGAAAEAHATSRALRARPESRRHEGLTPPQRSCRGSAAEAASAVGDRRGTRAQGRPLPHRGACPAHTQLRHRFLPRRHTSAAGGAIHSRRSAGGGQARFFGARLPDDVAASLRDADIFGLLSHRENVPCAPPEAQSHGLPSFPPAVRGVPELVDEDVGMASDVGLSEALADNTPQVESRFDRWVRARLAACAELLHGCSALGRRWADIYAAALPAVRSGVASR
jgi:hypothetical protein